MIEVSYNMATWMLQKESWVGPLPHVAGLAPRLPAVVLSRAVLSKISLGIDLTMKKEGGKCGGNWMVARDPRLAVAHIRSVSAPLSHARVAAREAGRCREAWQPCASCHGRRDLGGRLAVCV